MYVFTAVLIFVAIVSIDLFAGALAFGSSNVRMPFKKVLVINIIGKVIIGSALVAGHFLGQVIPDVVGIWLGFSILMALGIFKVIQSIINRNKPNEKKDITWLQSILLGVVLALDGAALSLGTTVGGMPFYFIYIVIAVMLVTDQLVFMLANKLGLYFSNHEKTPRINFDIIAGVFLIIIAVVKLVVELFA